ncbi:MAG: AAA family ATPase, partial [Deltaproteobacteria bacterium]|nr:AAA family ATPase [Deltaproteobacteria bacterium]
PLARSAAEQLEELIGLTEVKAHFARWRNAAAALRSQAPAPPPGSLRRGWARPERLCPSPSRSSPLNLHLLLTGSPGTGKTTVARLVGALYRELGLLELGHCLVVTRADLVGGYLGQTALRTRDAIDRALGGVLFLDEAYDTWRGPEDDFGQEAITTLLEAMSREEGRFAVVAAGYPGQMERWLQANPGLPRRFGERLHLADPGPAELQQLFERQLQRHPAGVSCAPELAEKLPAFFQALHGGRDERFGNCGEIVLLAEQTARAALARRARILRAEDLPERHRPLLETRPVGPGGLLVELDALVGLHRAKEQVRTWFHRLAIERRRQGEQARLAPGHLLFFGSPGTGKTTVARLMAEQLFALGLLPRRSLQRTTAQELIRGFVGQTSEAALTFLRQGLGGVIFIDEAHQLYAGQEADRASFGRDVLRALVPFAEDHRQECCIILAGYTVGLQLLLQADEGLAERFAAHVLFEDYDEAEMVQIFQGFCRQARPRPLLPEPELLGRLPLRFAALRAGLGGQFANARTVRKLYERCLDRQAERLASAGTEELGPDELFTLRSVDLPPVEQGWRDEEQGGPAPPAWR